MLKVASDQRVLGLLSQFKLLKCDQISENQSNEHLNEELKFPITFIMTHILILKLPEFTEKHFKIFCRALIEKVGIM